MTTDILVLILGVTSSITLLISSLSVHKKRLLIFAIITSTLIASQYGLVGAYVGLAAVAIGILRTIMVLASTKYEWMNHWLFIPIFMLIHSIAFVLLNNWAETTWVSFIPLVGGWLGTLSIFFTNLIYTKGILIVSGSLWVMYELHSALYGQLIGESLNILANTAALITLLVAAKRGIPADTLEDVDTQIIHVITTSVPVITKSIKTMTR